MKHLLTFSKDIARDDFAPRFPRSPDANKKHRALRAMRKGARRRKSFTFASIILVSTLLLASCGGSPGTADIPDNVYDDIVTNVYDDIVTNWRGNLPAYLPSDHPVDPASDPQTLPEAEPARTVGWGPSRTTYTVDRPAAGIAFNAITDNPNIGDERNFLGIRERGTDNLWSSNLKVERDKEYVIRIYVHNNASQALGLVAEDVRVMINLPTATVVPGEKLGISGILASSNATPNEVWDGASMWADEVFNVAYVAGSARYHTNASPEGGFILPDSVLTSEGALLGYDELDGRIPGCFQYAGYLTIVVRPQFAEAA